MSQVNNAALNGSAMFNVSKQMTVGEKSERSNLSAPLPSTRWVVVLAIASFIAIGVSGYLAYVGLTSSKIAGCGGGQIFDCGHVTSSQWSLWMGLPVSLLAVGLYVGLLGSLFVGASQRFSSSLRNMGWSLTTVFAIAAGLAAIWFISLQVFVLKHLCTYCLAAHACGLVAAAVVIWLRPVGSANISLGSLASVAGVTALIGGQLMTEAPKTYEIETFETPVTSDVEVFEFDAPFAAPVVPSDAPNVSIHLPSAHQLKQAIATVLSPTASLTSHVAGPIRQSQTKQQSDQSSTATPAKQDEPAKPSERRLVAINGGTVNLDVAQWPVAGSKTAKYVFVEMFDYSCPHCRQTHAAIKSAKEKLGGDLAVVVLPVPLNAACNSTIKVANPSFNESCEISKLAVSVWRVDPVKFTEFHNWMFASEKAPTYEMAKAHAEKLVDPKKLSKEIASGVSDQYIAKTVELYKRAGSGNVPKLMFPTTSVVGEFTSADSLVDIIKQQSKQ